MPKVQFVNEHRTVSAEAGRTVAEIARAAGVALGGQCFVEPSRPSAVSGRTWREALGGARGLRRFPEDTKVMGDVKVYSMAAGASRVRVSRPIDPPPQPVTDPTASRKPDDAASTAVYVHGHPSAIGRGVPEEAASVPAAPESHPNAARPASAYPPSLAEGGDDGKGS